MAEQELIDSIVSNETLGIKKKPSIFKILAVLGILTIVSITSYSLFLKTKKEESIPPLEIAGASSPINTATQPQEPLVTEASAPAAVTEPVQAPVVDNQLPPTTPPVINAVETVATAVPATAQVAAPVTTQPIQTVAAQQATPAPIASPTTTTMPPNPVQVATAPVQPVQTNEAAKTIATNEEVVAKPVIKKAKVAQRKKPVKKVVAKDTQQAYADEYTPKAPVTEEGVTHEEIIIFQ